MRSTKHSAKLTKAAHRAARFEQSWRSLWSQRTCSVLIMPGRWEDITGWKRKCEKCTMAMARPDQERYRPALRSRLAAQPCGGVSGDRGWAGCDGAFSGTQVRRGLGVGFPAHQPRRASPADTLLFSHTHIFIAPLAGFKVQLAQVDGQLRRVYAKALLPTPRPVSILRSSSACAELTSRSGAAAS